MIEARVIDTNVLVVASAAHNGSPSCPDKTPVQEAEIRQQVLDWLVEFEQDSMRHVVLDIDWLICKEYQRNLTDQDYGWLAIMAKYDHEEVIWTELRSDADGHALLPSALCNAVTDLDDRKMVAAVLGAQALGMACLLTNACDTDWLDCEDALLANAVKIEHLIEGWLRCKWEGRRKKL